jgi:hypothetical protein
MFPFYRYFSPHFRFPFSGDVNQQIAPETDWFFGNINPKVGDGEIEKEVFLKIASYGKQLGKITAVLLALVEEIKKNKPDVLKDFPELNELKQLHERIERIKEENNDRNRDYARRILDKLIQSNGTEFVKGLLKSYQEKIEERNS